MKKLLCVLVVFCGLAAELKAKVIIFDLGFTLIKQSWVSRIRAVGLWTGLKLYLEHGSKVSDRMRLSLYDVLDAAQELMPQGQCDTETPRDPFGRAMPELQQQWFAGNKTSADIRARVDIALNTYQGFTSSAHKTALSNTFAWMFDPREYARSWIVIDEAVKLLQECAAVRDEHGAQKNRILILSNFDAETFAYVRQNPALVPIFNVVQPQDIFVSGHMGDIKPHASIFKTMLTRAGVDARDCVFIDDQKDNCEQAARLGFLALQVKDGNFYNVRRQLVAHGVLS